MSKPVEILLAIAFFLFNFYGYVHFTQILGTHFFDLRYVAETKANFWGDALLILIFSIVFFIRTRRKLKGMNNYEVFPLLLMLLLFSLAIPLSILAWIWVLKRDANAAGLVSSSKLFQPAGLIAICITFEFLYFQLHKVFIKNGVLI